MPTTTRFDLSITLGNDAMLTPGDVADAITRVAMKLETYGAGFYDTDGPVRDINGNTVGTWKVDAYTTDV